MKKKNVNLRKLSFSKKQLITLTGIKADKVKGGASFTCDDTRKDCPFETRFIDCKSVVATRC